MTDEIEHIDIDLDEKLIKEYAGTVITSTMTTASASIIRDALAVESASINQVYEAIGRAVFNETLVLSLMKRAQEITQGESDATEE